MSSQAWHVRHSWTSSLALTAVYTGACLLGRATRLDGSSLSLVWPAAGVALLWLLLSWSRPAVLRRDALLLMGATVAINLATGAPRHLALVFAATNLLQAGVAAGVLTRRQQAWRMRSPAYLGLLVGAAAAVYRLVIGPTLADRVIALDLLLVALMTGIVVDAAHRDSTTWLNLLVVIAIIGFTATVAVSRFMEQRR